MIFAACFPGCRDMFRHQFSNGTGVRCWMAGYGKRRDDDSRFKTVLRKLDIPIFPDDRKYLFTSDTQVKSLTTVSNTTVTLNDCFTSSLVILLTNL